MNFKSEILMSMLLSIDIRKVYNQDFKTKTYWSRNQR